MNAVKKLGKNMDYRKNLYKSKKLIQFKPKSRIYYKSSSYKENESTFDQVKPQSV